jgi:3-methyl-2-oxobutanoate hydroxymethyltransferase
VHNRLRFNRVKLGVMPEFESKSDPKAMCVIYEYPIARAAEVAKVDAILIGDSLGMTSFGFNSTIPVTLDHIIAASVAVYNGAPNTFRIGDMPFGSYEYSDELAAQSAIRLIKEGKTGAVKLEGGLRVASRVKSIVECGIPVMGHLGITPQTSPLNKGFKPYGISKNEVIQLKRDLEELENAGAYSVLLEGVPSEISKLAKKWVKIPLYGIGSGPNTDGQLLLSYDLLGLYPDFKPKFARNFVAEIEFNGEEPLSFYKMAIQAIKKYVECVKTQNYPSFNECYHLPKESSDLLFFAETL